MKRSSRRRLRVLSGALLAAVLGAGPALGGVLPQAHATEGPVSEAHEPGDVAEVRETAEDVEAGLAAAEAELEAVAEGAGAWGPDDDCKEPGTGGGTPGGGADAPQDGGTGPRPGTEPAEPDDDGAQVPGGAVPGAEQPGAEVPGGEVPGAEVPGGEAPGTGVPDAEAPAEVPPAELPAAELPDTDAPAAEPPAAEPPAAEAPAPADAGPPASDAPVNPVPEDEEPAPGGGANDEGDGFEPPDSHTLPADYDNAGEKPDQLPHTGADIWLPLASGIGGLAALGTGAVVVARKRRAHT
ncbi:LPXTG cell wall anchor domain-containing protein [Streptomyces sp. B8F3]|uniref:LPXTG cell wall anchor domain-containing protein n=1 Tax=Streptomyces sp. B8F3 TaxID=3153573 RepID=UPI00325F005A